MIIKGTIKSPYIKKENTAKNIADFVFGGVDEHRKVLADIKAEFDSKLKEWEDSILKLLDTHKTKIDYLERKNIKGEKELRDTIAKVLTIQKGEKGEPGANGESPIIDYEFIASKVKVEKPKEVDYNLIFSKIPKEEELLKSFIEKVNKGEIKLNLKDFQIAIDNLERRISAHEGWKMRGGGDTVAAGSGISITKNANGVSTIAVSGLGSATVTPPETANGNTYAFTFATQPKLVFVDGGRAVQAISKDGTVNWTYAGTTLTMVVAPTFDIFALL